eukprot:7913901-Ditylum_brightwellii.AAC.1
MLQASLALVKNDYKPDGKVYDFERTTAFIILSDPVARKIKDNKGGTTAEMSGVHYGERGGAAQGGTTLGTRKCHIHA